MEQEKSKIFREFSIGGNEYYIRIPTLSVIREARYAYARSFTDAIKQGFLTRKKMEVTLQQAEAAVFQEYLDRRADLFKSMAETEEKILTVETPEDLDYLAEVMSIYRHTLLQEDMALSSLFSNTADQLAEDDKINFLVSSLVYKKSGEKVWSTFQDLLNETDEALIEACKYQIMCLDYKLNPEWESGLPETKAREKAQELREKSKKELEAKEENKQQKEEKAKGETAIKKRKPRKKIENIE